MRGSLKDIAEFFVGNGFAFLSGSLLVSLPHVDSFKGSEIKINGELLPIARAYKSKFLQQLSAYIGGGKA